MVTGSGSSRDSQKPSLNTIQDTTISSEESKNNFEPWGTQITQSEYEEIKDRVAAIETRISKEFTKLQSLSNNSLDSVDTNDMKNGPERVLAKFERTLEETEMMNASPMTEKLAKHLSRGLKIRSSTENRVLRSPSARKIGSIRRRSQENVRLTRNKSWHLGSNLSSPLMTKSARLTRKSPLQLPVTLNSPNIEKHIQIPRANLKRGRPNTFQNGLRSGQQPMETQKLTEHHTNTFTVTDNSTEGLKCDDPNSDLKNEQWVCANTFFGNCQTPNQNEENTLNASKNSTKASNAKVKPARKRLNMNHDVTPTNQQSAGLSTPRSTSNNVSMVDTMKTPMLPPRLPVVKKTPAKTPHSLSTNRNIFAPLWQQEQQQIAGRASIARLRSQNAGMVMAKAKLFDELVTDQPNARKTTNATKVDADKTANSQSNQENKPVFDSNVKNRFNHISRPNANSPRRNKNASGANRRQHLRAHRHTPTKKTPINLDKSILTISGNHGRNGRNTLSPAIQSPMTRRIASIDATPHAKGSNLITKPPRRIITYRKPT